jgi:hypothetical protein
MYSVALLDRAYRSRTQGKRNDFVQFRLSLRRVRRVHGSRPWQRNSGATLPGLSFAAADRSDFTDTGQLGNCSNADKDSFAMSTIVAAVLFGAVLGALFR